MDEGRPDPEALLRALQHEERGNKGGQLKIFLGMSAGVGKTYTMLESAQRARQNGINVVIGLVDTHGRQETAKLIEGLDVIPRKMIEYKGTEFGEMDLDAILKLRPQLVIVDELAHTNVPGSRHPKRWQDVIELLDAGIDVYTTLNVQHIESRKDMVENITGVNIRETVPDLILERADNIELVDITPAELLQRLKEGKVYLGPQSEIAARNFFKMDRLTALRELSLRFTAEKVDHDLHAMIQGTDKPRGWKAADKLLVCVSHSPHSQHLIRTARRLAFNLDAPWIALHVDNGISLDDEEKAVLSKNMALARELGAEVVSIADPDIVRAIQKIAHQRSVTQILIGRSPRSRFWPFMMRRGILERLINEFSETDIHVMHEQMSQKKKLRLAKQLRFSSNFADYMRIISLVIGLTLFCSFIVTLAGFRVVGFIYLISILIFGLFFTQGPVLVASLLSAIIMNYLFIPPQGTYVVSAQEEFFWFAVLFVTAMVTGVIASRIRGREALLVKRDESTQTIYEIVREIASAPSTPDLLVAIKARLSTLLEGKCEIILKSVDGGLNLDNAPAYLKDEKEIAVATWVFNNGKEAGWSTNTLSSVHNFYIPLKGFKEIVGLLCYQPNSPNKVLSIEDVNLLYTVARQLANYVERTISEDRTRKTEYMTQVEKVYQTILKSISTEIQTPLDSLKENIETLKVEKTPATKSNTVHQIEHTTEDLGRITDNIQAMSTLCAGLVHLKKEANSIYDVINNCVRLFSLKEKTHPVTTELAPNLPLVQFDYPLIELLLYNILFNSIEFSSADAPIKISAHADDGTIVVTIVNEGSTLPIHMIGETEKKYYLPGSENGVGLGLAIAESIAEVHKGKLVVHNREKGGTEFVLTLPLT